jgi:hypothetical protein
MKPPRSITQPAPFSFVSVPSGIAKRRPTPGGAPAGSTWTTTAGKIYSSRRDMCSCDRRTSDHLQYLQPPLLLRNVLGHFGRADTGAGSVSASRWGTRDGVRRSGQRRRVTSSCDCGTGPHLLATAGIAPAGCRSRPSDAVQPRPSGHKSSSASRALTQHFAVTTGSAICRRATGASGRAGPRQGRRAIRWPSGAERDAARRAGQSAVTLRERALNTS